MRRMKGRSFIQILWIALLKGLVLAEDGRRPIWNVGHMVNSLWQVDYFLDRGANSVEFDVAFDWQGNAKFTFHGIPCDCFRNCMHYEDIDRYIEYLRILTTPGGEYFREELVLLFFDLKVQGLTQDTLRNAGKDLATKLLDHYWKRGKSGARSFVLMSMPSVFQIELVKSFMKTLQDEGFGGLYKDKVGFDFSGNEDLNIINSVLKDAQVSGQIWQGDGITNCLPRGTSRLLDAISRRDDMKSEFVDKVYWWTVDKMATMRRTLSLGVDAMITNYPHRLVEVLNEDEFRGVVRLATIEDIPWEKYMKRNSNFLVARKGNFSEEEEILYNS